MANLIEYIQSQVYENSTEDISGSIMQQVLTRMASDEGVVNVHTISGQTPFADYNNAQAARDAVPAGFKKLGLIITYKLSSGWYIDEFIGSATSGWSTASNWKCLGPISVSQNASTGKTTITIGSESFDVATQPVSVSQNTLSIGSDEVGELGGQIITSPEWMRVVTDSNDKVLYGVKTDGKFYFGEDCPPQIKEYINSKISNVVETHYDYYNVSKHHSYKEYFNVYTVNDGWQKITYNSSLGEYDDLDIYQIGEQCNFGGDTANSYQATSQHRGVAPATITQDFIIRPVYTLNEALEAIPNDIKSSFFAGQVICFTNANNEVEVWELQADDSWSQKTPMLIQNPEFIQVTTDSEGKILQSRNSEGVNKEYVGLETPKVSIDGATIENIQDTEGRTEIKTDADGRILSYRDSEGVMHEEVGIETNHLGLSSDATQDLINALDALGYTANNPADWSDSEFVEIPIPSVCAVVNIEVDSQAEAKGVDIPTYIQFWDKSGNYFRKPIELNAQGSSSMDYHIKNQSIDFTDGSKLKFGNWVPCDSFHIKKYFIDVFRGQCIVGYWLTEQMYQTRPYGERRPWDYLNSFNDVDNSNGSFSKDYDTGALAHPDGFPVKVFFNGKNAGIYAFNLKKDRTNYYCKKDKQKQIILDGVLGSTFWMANGDLRQNGEEGGNIWHDFEVRNPKISKDINGNNYDGDNPTEPSDDYSTTKAAIERLTTAITLVNAESTTEAKKAKFEEFFLVPFLIDYDLIGQVIHNYDGYRKNWIWCCWDGNLWCPTSYDMDSIFGMHWNGASYVSGSLTSILGTSDDLPTGTDLLKGLYQTEMRARYKELRDNGIFSVDNIVSLLEKWVNACGYNNLKEDVEEIVTSPYIEDGNIVIDGEGNPILIPNTPSYRDGNIEEYVYPPATGGWYNSVLRVKNWLIQRFITLDSFYNYEQN